MRTVAPSTGVREQLEEALASVAGGGSDDVAVRAEALYAHWYTRPPQPSQVPPGCPPDLAEMLRAAHAGFRDWEGGWRVESVGPRGQAVVRRAAELRLLERSDYAPTTRRGLLPRTGDDVSITRRRDRVDRDDGWWRTSGRSWSWVTAPACLVRLYFNRGVAGLPALVAGLTGLLADEPEPWLLKCATDPAVHARSDATVAYLTPSTVERRGADVVELALALAADGHARAGGPPLTMPVVPGLAVAFDPGGDESFGAHRCRLIAEARGGTVDSVLERFVGDGVDPARPWARRDDPRLPWER
jgi:HopA1 effector protein family